jgi:carboxyl-terminal processing protease
MIKKANRMNFKKYLGKKFFAGAGLVAVLSTMAYKADDRLFEIAKNIDIFATLYKELNALYVDEINPTKAMQTGIRAMLKELDPYTVFYAEDDIEDYFTQNTGSYNGIGASIENFENKHLVMTVFEGSPADKAGIKIGDEVLEINNVAVSNKNAQEFGRLLKGQKNKTVKLDIFRPNTNAKLSVNVARDVVKTPNVPHTGIVKDDVGYVQLTEFSATASKEVKAAILDLKGKGMKKLILDLRGNGGGLLQMAIEICNFFVPKGQLIVETKGKVKEWNTKYSTQAQPLDTEMPVVVLINGSSASASEIVSGTLQDYDRAVIVGSRSYGKGLVQLTKPLSFNTSFKVTTSKYYIPSGRCIQAIDYGSRNEEGKVSKLPDSLRVPFKTKAGRVVLDGAGIDPDIVTEAEKTSDYTASLLKQLLIFKYANKYYYEHINEKPKENFSLSASDLEGFENWLKTQKNTFKTQEQKHLDNLEKAAKESGEWAKMKNATQDLQKVAEQNLATLSRKYRDEIKRELEKEILGRYYYQKVMKFAALDKDIDIQKAMEVLNNPSKYSALLKNK